MNVTCTIFQGTFGNTVATPFGDGPRCAAGSVIRSTMRIALGASVTLKITNGLRALWFP